MSSQNFIKTKTDKKVWEKNTIVSGYDREKQKMEKELKELKNKLYKMEKEQQQYLNHVHW